MAVANIIRGGNLDSFDALIYPEQNQSNKNYIQQQFQNIQANVNNVSQQFLDRTKELYEKVNNSEAMRVAKSVIRHAKGMLNPNVITAFNDVYDVQFAQPLMQRYIMAEPTIREQYHRQTIDGFSDTYIDMEPKAIGEDHYDYRRVMNGILVETNEGWESTTYSDDTDERDLEFDEQLIIMSNWDIINIAMNPEFDPTDIYNY